MRVEVRAVDVFEGQLRSIAVFEHSVVNRPIRSELGLCPTAPTSRDRKVGTTNDKQRYQAPTTSTISADVVAVLLAVPVTDFTPFGPDTDDGKRPFDAEQHTDTTWAANEDGEKEKRRRMWAATRICESAAARPRQLDETARAASPLPLPTPADLAT